MKKIVVLVLIGLSLFGCAEESSEKKETSEKTETPEKVEFNEELAGELKKMAEVDQVAAYIPQGEHKKMTEEQWSSFKDSVYTTHQKRLKQIFDKWGFVGFDLAGEEGSRNFWVMVQHSDHSPDFQQEVLEKMKIEVEKGNAIPSDYGLLVDRVRLNTGQKQVFGTQLAYSKETGQAYPRNLEDSLNVNKRRISIGLEPIEEYLNRMTELHFEINKETLVKMGITEPKLYGLKE